MAKKDSSKKGGKDKAAQPAPQPNFSVNAADMKLPEGFKVRRQVTVPTLSLKEGKDGTLPPPRYLQFNEAMHLSTYVDPDPKKAKEKPATISGVTDRETGEMFQFLVPSVVESQLKRDYPEDGYVGKIFRITCLGKRAGKRYRDFSIFEIEAG